MFALVFTRGHGDRKNSQSIIHRRMEGTSIIHNAASWWLIVVRVQNRIKGSLGGMEILRFVRQGTSRPTQDVWRRLDEYYLHLGVVV